MLNEVQVTVGETLSVKRTEDVIGDTRNTGIISGSGTTNKDVKLDKEYEKRTIPTKKAAKKGKSPPKARGRSKV